MSGFVRDLRYTLRQLRRAPFFSLTVLLTLTFAIGATAALSGVLRSTLLNPLPYPRANRLVQIQDHNQRGFKTNGLMTVARARDLASLEHDGHKVFSAIGYYYFNDGQITLPGHEPLRTSAASVSKSFFKTLGMRPLLGRTIETTDGVRGAPVVAVLSHRLWMSAFSGDRHILGRTVQLASDQATVIGVMPETFNLPAGIDLWYAGYFPGENSAVYRGDGNRYVQVLGRLDSTESLHSAQGQIALLAAQLAKAFPQTDAPWRFEMTSLRASLFGDYRHALLLISTAVGLVLLVAAVNIAGLQLSRNAAREGEFAVRTALGVPRLRLARQLLTESTLLVIAGSCGGVLFGAVLLQLFATALPAALLRIEKPHIDLFTLTVACAVAGSMGLLTGLVPALQSTRASITRNTQLSLGKGTRRFGNTFTIAQIALALVVLTLSAAVLRQLYALLHTPLGFDTAQVQGCSIDLPWAMPFEKRGAFYRQVEHSLAALPGVSGVGAITVLPLGDFSLRRTFDIAGQSPTPNHDSVIAEGRGLTPGYLSTMHIPLLAGRMFSEADEQPKAPAVVLINHKFAARYFAGRSPLGQRLTGGLDADGKLVSREIIGVIGDVHGTDGTLQSLPQPEVYNASDGGWPHMQFAIRSTLPTASLEQEVHHAVAALDSTASVGPLTPLAASIDLSLQQPRWNAALLTGFAALSLLLVSIGVYGLIAFHVAQRTREIGLRLALGSTRGAVVGLLLTESARLLVAGLAFGGVGSWLASRLLANTVTQPSNLLLLPLATACILSAAVLCATWLPARRAASIDPMQALRSE